MVMQITNSNTETDKAGGSERRCGKKVNWHNHRLVMQNSVRG